MKKIFLLFTCLTCLYTTAHEFWLQPLLFHYSPGDTATVHFYVGENFTGEFWGRDLSKIQSLRHFSRTGITDASYTVTGNKVDSMKLALPAGGTHLIAFNSTNSFITLQPREFNAYLEEDGLYGAIQYRKKHQQTDTVGREYYQRSVKTLLQCGNTKDETYRTNTGLPLEIIPGLNPYIIQKPQRIPFKLLYKNKPLGAALVKVWHKMPGRTATMLEMKTDIRGIINVAIQPRGTWLVSSVHMVHNKADTVAQWQSYWGSFCFGY
ncbi:MAG TPA: DUF4198 domain-containing protein [Ferruginibacter sp.]|nr:DUF4198 domain-containing protein [Ferruginibacter sp.]HMP20802.1 DUF4198 domain-containing protein [Ferruginibacter sp.]